MKFVYPDIDCVFDTSQGKVHTIVIENQALFLSLVTDLQNQLLGREGRAVLSSEDGILPMGKHLEVLDRFVPFDMNAKTLLSKMASDMEIRALSDDFVTQTKELIGQIDSLLTTLSFGYACDIQFRKVNIGSVIRASGLEICEDYENLGEKIVDYFELVKEFIGKKLFVTVNLRAYLADKDAELFMQTVLSHGYELIMIENCEHRKTKYEKRWIIDSDLCLIG